MRAQRIGGYTLIETLVVVALIALLITAAPSFEKIIGESRQRSRTFALQRLLQLARASAITTGRVTTLCGSGDGIKCIKDWQSPTIIIFDDRNENHAIDDGEKIFRQETMAESHWYWRGSNRPYLRYRADGTPKEWGHFTLCPSTKTINYATQVILNFVGRPYDKDVPLAQLERDESCT
jgi:type IV fimbrial biogenesis protein FimT